MRKGKSVAKLSRKPFVLYRSSNGTVSALHMRDGLSLSGEMRLLKNGISEKYQIEILTPETRRTLAKESRKLVILLSQ